MTLEEQREYWIEQYEKERKKNKEIKDKLQEMNISAETLLAEFERLENIEDERDELKINIEELAREMDKNGSMYWAGRVRKL